MKIGLFGIGSGICADPKVATEVAQYAEASGLDSLWTGEHVVLPEPRQAPSPADPEFAMLHPSTILAYVAGVTHSIRLGTGIVLIAQRNPVVLAKEMASLDVVSGGRLLLGIGAGYLHQEFDALGIPFNERGARTDEYVHAMRSLWNDDRPSFNVKFVQFENVRAEPRPIQAGGPPIIVGGSSDAAVRRTVEYAQGWYGFALNVDQTRDVLRRLHDAGATDIEISVTPSVPINDDTVKAFGDIGVDRLISLVSQRSVERIQETIDTISEYAS